MLLYSVIGLTSAAAMLGTFAVSWPLALLNTPPKERKRDKPKVREEAVTRKTETRKPVLRVVK